jgi:hypothetical protein
MNNKGMKKDGKKFLANAEVGKDEHQCGGDGRRFDARRTMLEDAIAGYAVFVRHGRHP